MTFVLRMMIVAGLLAAPAAALEATSVGPKAYIVAEITVTDPAVYEGYKSAVSPLVTKYGGRYLVRGGDAQSVEGEKPGGRIVILEFPTLTMAEAFVQSDDYRPVAQIRQKSATSRIIMVEGFIP